MGYSCFLTKHLHGKFSHISVVKFPSQSSNVKEPSQDGQPRNEKTKDSSNYVFNSLQSLVDRLFGLKCSDVSFYCESPYLQKGGGG